MIQMEHQCPYCELRFAYLAEVKDHIAHDHPTHLGVVEGLDPHELPRAQRQGPIAEIVLTSHQCPWCELRFAFTNELHEHVEVDHAGHRAVTA